MHYLSAPAKALPQPARTIARTALALVAAGLLLSAPPALAQNRTAQPQISRDVTAAQADGAIHTVRVIPETCTRFEGRFTGRADEPYQLRAVTSSPTCQARARLLPFAQANVEQDHEWVWLDQIRIPRQRCPQQHAVLDVWRKTGRSETQQYDAQGRVRVYLQDALNQQARTRAQQALTQFTVRMGVEGAACD